jgi:hypothetical protein
MLWSTAVGVELIFLTGPSASHMRMSGRRLPVAQTAVTSPGETAGTTAGQISGSPGPMGLHPLRDTLEAGALTGYTIWQAISSSGP